MKSFNEIYQEVYKDCQYSLEHARKQALIGSTTVMSIIIIIASVLGIMTNTPFFIIGGIVLCFLYYRYNNKRSKYTNMFKQNVITKFVKAYSPNLEFQPNRSITPSVYRQGEFESFDIFYGEDAIIGTLEDGNVISMSEVKAVREDRDSDGDKTYTTVFHGMFAEVRLPKLVCANIKIRRDQILFESKNRVEMDSGEFEKKFSVFSTNPIIAMQLLTADIMQMFLDFKEKNKITPELTIKSDKMYIRFHTGDVFEANVMKRALDFDTLLKYYNIITFTLEITEKMAKNIKETEI